MSECEIDLSKAQCCAFVKAVLNLVLSLKACNKPVL